MSVATNRMAVEHLADVFDRRGPDGVGTINVVLFGAVAATLRALLAERDAARANAWSNAISVVQGAYDVESACAETVGMIDRAMQNAAKFANKTLLARN